MDHYTKLVIAAATFISTNSFAGFAQVVPPSNYTVSGGASWYKAAANESSFVGGIRGASGVINAGGKSVVMPVAYRFAANAGTFAARSLFLNPWVIGGLAVGSAIAAYYQSNNVKVETLAGVPTWVRITQETCASGTTCIEYRVSQNPDVYSRDFCAVANLNMTTLSTGSYNYFIQTCDAVSRTFTYGRSLKSTGYQDRTGLSGSLSTWPQRPYTAGTNTAPISQSEFESIVSPLAIPSGLPQILPDPLPVEIPILNPSSDPVPIARPLRVPQGLPVPVVPATNPATYKTPVIDFVPDPTVPWQVDLQPKDIISTDPNPVTPTDPGTNPGTPDPSGSDLCIKNPDILACKKVTLDTITAVPVPNTNRAVLIDKDPNYGNSSGTCPAPKSITIAGKYYSVSMSMICDFAGMIKPILIGFAYLSSALMFFGFMRNK